MHPIYLMLTLRSMLLLVLPSALLACTTTSQSCCHHAQQPQLTYLTQTAAAAACSPALLRLYVINTQCKSKLVGDSAQSKTSGPCAAVLLAAPCACSFPRCSAVAMQEQRTFWAGGASAKHFQKRSVSSAAAEHTVVPSGDWARCSTRDVWPDISATC